MRAPRPSHVVRKGSIEHALLDSASATRPMIRWQLTLSVVERGLVTLIAHECWQGHDVWVRRAAWYDKTLPTFVDALAEVRRALWKVPTFRMSAPGREMVQVPLEFIERLADALCYAA